ncbi:hypothetical protein HZY97_20190 [Sphingomonas sp. R-74633]|uniref:tail completion protein gp17 n=1 Tax=Sphingomonas sp. R-74633 TaxID=2751188 RepID=UPI0015D11AC7|nr:hypothetical protein [Sphingomonas sp. R-74633]NYT43106.1 hypothetical protein [Sphingomonas sp. R-74633]
MTGASIIGELLRSTAAITAVVPAERIKGGRLPDGIELPALLVRTTSSLDRQNLKRTATTRRKDRVSVTVRAATYREQGAVIELVRTTLGGLVADIGGKRVPILTAGTGPDLAGPADTFEQTQDFRVSFDAA